MAVVRLCKYLKMLILPLTKRVVATNKQLDHLRVIAILLETISPRVRLANPIEVVCSLRQQ